jgi:cytoskeletal protein CcmA (bactofilin family)
MNFNDSSRVSNAVIGSSIHIEGTISGDENLVIDGRVDGSIFVQNAMVTIAKTGTVRADVQAKVIKVDGEVRGELRGTESVEIGPSGTVIGDIRSPRVMLQDGCQFKGLVDMDYKESSSVGTAERISAGKKPPAPKALTPNLVSQASSGSHVLLSKNVNTAPKLSVPNLSHKSTST